MVGRSSGLGGVALLLALVSACAGKSVTPNGGAAAGGATTETELPCLGNEPHTLFGQYQTGFAVAGHQLVIAAGDGIRRLPLAGGDSVLLAPASDPGGPLVLNGNAYFSTTHPLGDLIDGKQPMRQTLDVVPLAGGDVTTAFTTMAQLADSAVDDSALYLYASADSIAQFTPPSALRTLAPLPLGTLVDAVSVQGDSVFVAGQTIGADLLSAGAILRVPKSGAAVTTIVSHIGHPWNLVADETGLYWVEEPAVGTFGPSHIAHAELDGSNVTTLVASVSATSLALHDGRLYFSTADTISSIPVSGGTPTPIVTGQKSAGALAVAGQNLLWIDPAVRALSDPTVPAVLTACIPR